MFINRKSNVSYLKCVAFFSFIRLNNSHISSKVTAGYIQYLRNDIIENSKKDYVLTARSKGLSMNKIYNKHILRNSLIPIITFLGADIVSILGGAVITETIFSYNGIGKLFLESVIGQDYPLMMALTLFFSFLGLLGNLISDITYGFIDPRIRSN